MGKQNSFLRDSFITIVRQVTSIVIGVLLLVILARVLGKDLQGTYALVTVFAAVLGMVINAGINISTVYYVSKSEIDVNGAFFNNLVLGLGLGAVGIAAGFVFVKLFGNQLFPEVSNFYFYIILFIVPLILLNTFFQTIFQGIQDFRVFNTILIVTQMVNFLFVLILVVWLDFGLEGALISFAIGHASTFLFIIFLLIKEHHISIRKTRLDFIYMKKSLSYGLKSYLSNLVTFLNYRLDIFFVGVFVNPAAVGLYTVAIQVAEKMAVFTQSISHVLLPRIASMETEEERNKLTSIVSRFTMLAMVMMSFVMFLVAGFLIPLLFGEEYTESALLLQVLLPGISLLAVEKILSNDIAARGKPEINMYVSIFNVTLATILNLALIPVYEALGAAIATTFTYSLSLVIKAYLFRKITGERYRAFLLFTKEDFDLAVRIIKRQKFVKKYLT